MTIPLLCIVALVAVTYGTKIPVGIAMAKEKRYDNKNPRDQQTRLTGWGRRALAAHQNAFEVFPIFSAAVFIAHLTGADPFWSSLLCVGFVISRVLYTALYLADLDRWRSAVWFVGIGACFALALLSGTALK